MRFKDLTGQRFGRLSVVARATNLGRFTAFQCLCDCGSSVIVRSHSLLDGETKSCGCARAELMAAKQARHGHYGSPTYLSWAAMMARCRDPKHEAWKNYGGRGITVCRRWRTFANFLADMGVRPPGRSIDRIDPDGNYEPGNCRWATRLEQRHNRRKGAANVSSADIFNRVT